jgi:carbon storage regulator
MRCAFSGTLAPRPSPWMDTLMLVISRKLGETIRISDDIEIVVLAVNRYQVKVGIAAPREIEVWRTELLKKEAVAD